MVSLTLPGSEPVTLSSRSIAMPGSAAQRCSIIIICWITFLNYCLLVIYCKDFKGNCLKLTFAVINCLTNPYCSKLLFKNCQTFWKLLRTVNFEHGRQIHVTILHMSIPSSPNGGSISMMVFSRMGCHWKVMVDRLWFAI